MFEKIIEQLKGHCAECPVGKALHLLIDSSAKPELPEPIKAKPTKAAKTNPDPNRIEKACNRCHTVKPLADYRENAGCLDGHEGTCNACKAARQREKYRERVSARKQAAAPAPIGTGSNKKFECTVCGVRFNALNSLDEHTKLRHSS